MIDEATRLTNIERFQCLLAEMREHDGGPKAETKPVDPVARLDELRAQFEALPVRLSPAALRAIGREPPEDEMMEAAE